MFTRRRHFLSMLAAAAIFCALPLSPVLAQSLADLHATGAVGEKYDGYAVARDSGYSGFVNDINAKRKKVYQDAAAKNNADVGEVGKVYAQRIIKKAPAGTWLLGQNNQWTQK